MDMNDSFFDNIEVISSKNITFQRPQTICKSLERTFTSCSNPKKQSVTHNYVEDQTIQKNHSYKLDYFLKQQAKATTQSKSYRSVKNQEINVSSNIPSIPQKSYLKQQMRLKINLENDHYQSNIRHDTYQSNLRLKTQSSHNTTNPYQQSLVNLMKQQMQKQQQSFANICKTLNDESKIRISSTHRQSIAPQKNLQRQDSQNIRKSNSVYMQEFRKIFSKSKYSIHN